MQHKKENNHLLACPCCFTKDEVVCDPCPLDCDSGRCGREEGGGGKGGMVTHVVTWLLHYCGFVSHKQLVTTNFFNLHFDFVTCHKQLLYHEYWVTPAYNSVPLPKYIRRQGTKTLICCLSAVAKITICLCCTTPESVFCCLGAGIF